MTHLPLAGSPLVDAGDPAGCALAVDQRGVARPINCGGGPRCDIGAVEVECLPPSIKLYESPDRDPVVATVHLVGIATSSPYDHAPAAPAMLYYQADDGAGFPPLLQLVKGGRGLLIHY